MKEKAEEATVLSLFGISSGPVGQMIVTASVEELKLPSGKEPVDVRRYVQNTRTPSLRSAKTFTD